MNATRELTEKNWDDEYRQNGRYAGASALPFVEIINDYLEGEQVPDYGLYVGCGNGRNYLPLHDLHPALRGMDISSEAIKQLHAKDPSTQTTAFWGDFLHYNGANIFNYALAIQVFQHGDRQTIDQFFQKSHEVLKFGGYLFLRVNSVSTEMVHEHDVIEDTKTRGRTIRYNEGPKQGELIHFFHRRELGHLATKHAFKVIRRPLEVIEQRAAPHNGTTWTQWETIWQKQ